MNFEGVTYIPCRARDKQILSVHYCNIDTHYHPAHLDSGLPTHYLDSTTYSKMSTAAPQDPPEGEILTNVFVCVHM